MPNKSLKCDNTKPHLHVIDKGVFLGTRKSANSPSVLEENEISHIISFENLDNCNVEAFENRGGKYFHFDVPDDSDTKWEEVWEKMIKGAIECFLDDEKEAKKTPTAEQPKLLFQFSAGLRRSPLMTCCFLVGHRGLKPLDAMKRVTDARRCRQQVVGFYKTALPLLTRLGEYTFSREDFDAREWDNEGKEVVCVKGFSDVWPEGNVRPPVIPF